MNDFIDRAAVAAAKFAASLDERLPAVQREFGISNLPTHFFNGKPCPHGHPGLRYAKSGRCVACCLAQHQRKEPA